MQHFEIVKFNDLKSANLRDKNYFGMAKKNIEKLQTQYKTFYSK